jgi:hypothetical protein
MHSRKDHPDNMIGESSNYGSHQTQIRTALVLLLVSFLTIGVTAQKLTAVKPGTWGARGVAVVVEKRSVGLEFDCAKGAISRQLKVDNSGKFSAEGTYTALSHGPIRVNNLPKPQLANYEGKITGKILHFVITLTETKTVIGEFSVELGKMPKMHRCL